MAPGESIQTAVNSSLSVCIGAGVHQVPLPILPRTGTTLTGEYGAVLDGTGMGFRASPETRWQGIIQAHNANVDNVTIRNLVIRDSAERGIHGYSDFSDGWVVDHNEIAFTKYGVSIGNSATVSNNLIHDNRGNVTSSDPAQRGGGYAAYRSHDVLFVDNEIYANGPEQKIMETQRVTFRRNFVHHNVGDGIWYDSANSEGLVEDNVVRDNGGSGIFHEINAQPAVIRNNVVSRNAFADIFVSGSAGTEVYGNVVTTTLRGIWLFVDSARGYDLANNYVHDNEIVVLSGNAVQLSCINTTSCDTYETSKGNRFEANAYDVPDPTGQWWYSRQTRRTWAEWRSVGYDSTGTVS